MKRIKPALTFLTALLLCLFMPACGPSKPMATSPSEISKMSPKPRNVILMIGDGMGLTQVTAGIFENNNHLEIERCTIIGLHKPYSANDLITDSAAGATALSCGLKTNNKFLAEDLHGKPCKTLLEMAEDKNMKTGLVVTSTIVHATPAAFFSHQSNRDAYEDIAKDLVHADVDFLVGGGKKYFDRRTNDTLNLIQLMKEKQYLVTDYFEQNYADWSMPKVDKFCYFSADGDPLPAASGRTYLPKASRDATQFLKRIQSSGFFLMIEGSQIDWGGHANDSKYTISEMLDFDKAIKEVLDFAENDGQTLVIITGDHETGGYSIVAGNKFSNLIGAFTTTKHTADLIPVYAFGPGAEKFSGIYENTAIYDKIKSLLFE